MSEEKTAATDKGGPEKGAQEKGERIAKRLARAGICSRRDAERWIAEGRVVVNGKKLDTPAVVVQPTDMIVVDGKPLAEPERTRVWRYHKPAGLMTTHKDPEGRATVFDRLPEGMPRVISVGRLDYASEGLLLLTNDGELARKLELPSNSWTRRYRIRVHGEVDPERLLELEKGITVDGVRYEPIKALLDRQKGANAWVTVSIREGKNREVRRVFDHLGWPVLRLIRVAYGPFQLGNLEEGGVEEVPGKVFKEQLGLEDSKWAKAEADEHPQLPHAAGARKGGRTKVEGGKDRPFSDSLSGRGRAAKEGAAAKSRTSTDNTGGKGRPSIESMGGKGRPSNESMGGKGRPSNESMGGKGRPGKPEKSNADRRRKP